MRLSSKNRPRHRRKHQAIPTDHANFNEFLEVFKRTHGVVHDPAKRAELFDPIMEWYLSTYGEEARWDGILGRFPIIIRNKLYLGITLWDFENRPGAYKEQIENLPREVSDTFDDSEFREIAQRLTEARTAFFMLYNLNLDDHLLREEARDLFHMGIKDLDSAVSVLKYSSNVHGSIVASHEAAEKFLKIALMRSKSTRNARYFRHDIPKLFKELVQTEPRLGWLIKPAKSLQKLSPDTQMRYKLTQRSEPDAVSAFNSALFVCGVLANIWLYDEARGNKIPSFSPARFYKNCHGRTFYCKTLSKDSAVLTCFSSDARIGAFRADIGMSALQSSLYLEVEDVREDALLRQELMEVMRNSNRRMTSEEAKIRMVNGDEGCYNSMMIKVKAPKP